MRLLVVILASIQVPAFALCLNPLGCMPATQRECIERAQSARTETAAKASIIECRRLPIHTQAECKSLAVVWAKHLKSSNGIEWTWPERASKRDCRRHFPRTFRTEDWLTAEYCERNADRIEYASREVDAITGGSLLIEQARRKTPDLAGLDDESALEVLRQAYYPDILPQELAARTFVDSPPDVWEVKQSCAKLIASRTLR